MQTRKLGKLLALILLAAYVTAAPFEAKAKTKGKIKISEACAAVLRHFPSGPRLKQALRSARMLTPGMSLPSAVQHR